MNKNEICFVRAKMKEDYVFDGIRNMGYHILVPYTDWNILLRCIREAWFRMKLPYQSLFYNHKIKKIQAKCFIVKDPLITTGFLSWLQEKHPNAKIILEYDNRVSNSIDPLSVESSIKKWSYDPDDCEKYGMKRKPINYLDIYRVKPSQSPKLDLLYLGRDKGRAEELLELQQKFEKLGIHTYFHICADRRYLQKQKPFYKPLLTYLEYLEILKESRAILNIMPEGQRSITQREMECVFNGIKCFTNNKAIKSFSLYHPSRYFILGEDDINIAVDFLKSEYLPISDEELEQYKYQHAIECMVEY